MSSADAQIVPLASHRMTTWQGLSARPYAFWAYSFEENLPAAPGVYAYARTVNGSDNWQVFFVGETDNFAETILEDGMCESARDMGATHIMLHCQGGGEVARLEVEGDLMARLDPPLNQDTTLEAEPAPALVAIGG